MSQLVLPLRLADHAVFASFLASGNETLVATLIEIGKGNGGPGCWISGAPATGKSHLLQAVCEAVGDTSVYVPLRDVADAGPGLLEGLASRAVICIDDVDIVLGDPSWEVALFDLCNRAFDANRQLICSAAAAPRKTRVRLADLASRLSRLPVFQVRPLDEAQRAAALQLRSRHRGLELPDDTARYLLTRSRRDMKSLYALLDRLDVEALRAKRRLTIPFVREVLSAAKR